MGLLQHCRKLASLRLKFGVATNVMLVDKDIGNGSLLCHFLKSVLNGGAISYMTILSAAGKLYTNQQSGVGVRAGLVVA